MYFGEEIESKDTYYIEGWEGKLQLNLPVSNLVTELKTLGDNAAIHYKRKNGVRSEAEPIHRGHICVMGLY